MRSDRYRASSRTVRLGLALGAVAAAVAALAATGEMLQGPARDAPDTTVVLDVGVGVAALGIGGAVVLAACAAAPVLWAHLTGTVIAWGLAATGGFLVASARQSGDLAPESDVSLLSGGMLLILAFVLGLIGVVVALVGFRQVALSPAAGPDEPADAVEEPAPGETGAPSGPPGSRLSTAALTLGILSFIVWVVAPLAVALGTLALGPRPAGEGPPPGRGSALAGVVLGIIAISLATTVALIGALVAAPVE